MAALGRSGIEITPPEVSLQINGVTFSGGRNEGGGVEREKEAREAMRKKELKIIVRPGDRKGEFAVWTCDLSLDYVRINSHYSWSSPYGRL